MDESDGIFFDEKDALIAVRDKRIGLDQAAYAAKVAGLTTAFAYCLVAVSATDPLTPGAYLLCSGPYAAGMAAAGNELNNEMYYAKKEYSNANSIAAGVWDRRNKKIKALYNRLISNEILRHESNRALNYEDLRLCVERMRNHSTRKEIQNMNATKENMFWMVKIWAPPSLMLIGIILSLSDLLYFGPKQRESNRKSAEN